MLNSTIEIRTTIFNPDGKTRGYGVSIFDLRAADPDELEDEKERLKAYLEHQLELLAAS